MSKQDLSPIPFIFPESNPFQSKNQVHGYNSKENTRVNQTNFDENTLRRSSHNIAIEHAVETQGAQKAVDNTAETKTTEKAADQVENTGQEETDSGKNLAKRLREETPERVELLLGVRHILNLALGSLDRLGDGTSQLKSYISKVMLLGSSLTGAGLVLGIALDSSIRIQSADTAVQFAEDLATLLDERLDILHELLLIKLFLGDRTHAVKTLLDDGTERLGELAVGLSLLTSLDLVGILLRLLDLRLGNVLDERAVSDSAALGIDDITVAVNLLAGADGQLTSRQLADDVTILVNDLTLAVDLAAFHGADLLLNLRLRLRFPSLGLAKKVAVAVENVAILIDGTAKENLGVAFDQATNNVSSRSNNVTLLVDGAARKLGERTLLEALALTLGHKLSPADNVARLAADVSVLVAHATDETLDIALDDAAEDGAVSVDDIASLVDALASKDRLVDNDLLFRFRLRLGLGLPTLSLTNGVAAAVEDITFVINLLALQLLRVTLNQATDDLAIEVDIAVRLDNSAGEVFEWGGLAETLTLGLGNGLSLANHLAGIVPDLTLLVGLATDEMLQDARNNTANGLALVIDQIASLVDSSALEDAVVDGVLEQLLGDNGVKLGLANNAAALVDNVTLGVNDVTSQVGRVTLSNSANRGIIEDDLALVVDFRTRELFERLQELVASYGNSALVGGNGIADGAENTAGILLDSPGNTSLAGFAGLGGLASLSLQFIRKLRRRNVAVGNASAASLQVFRKLGDKVGGELRLGVERDLRNRDVGRLKILGELALEGHGYLGDGNVESCDVVGDLGLKVVVFVFLGDSLQIVRKLRNKIGGKLRLSIERDLGDGDISRLKILRKLALQSHWDLGDGNVEGCDVVRYLGLKVVVFVFVFVCNSLQVVRKLRHKIGGELCLGIEGDLGDGDVGRLEVIGKLALQSHGNLGNRDIKGRDVVRNLLGGGLLGRLFSGLCRIILEGLRLRGGVIFFEWLRLQLLEILGPVANSGRVCKLSLVSLRWLGLRLGVVSSGELAVQFLRGGILEVHGCHFGGLVVDLEEALLGILCQGDLVLSVVGSVREELSELLVLLGDGVVAFQRLGAAQNAAKKA
ncbi:LEA domain-containing protein [Colletotrichum asianum]